MMFLLQLSQRLEDLVVNRLIEILNMVLFFYYLLWTTLNLDFLYLSIILLFIIIILIICRGINFIPKQFMQTLIELFDAEVIMLA